MSGPGIGWAVPEDGLDYFRQEQKRADLADFRPGPRDPLVYVGPGLVRSTTRVENMNDPIALNNGFFSTAPGANAAPNPTDAFVLFTISDDEYGGFQEATSLAGPRWRRTFWRREMDPSYVEYSAWSSRP